MTISTAGFSRRTATIAIPDRYHPKTRLPSRETESAQPLKRSTLVMLQVLRDLWNCRVWSPARFSFLSQNSQRHSNPALSLLPDSRRMREPIVCLTCGAIDSYPGPSTIPANRPPDIEASSPFDPALNWPNRRCRFSPRPHTE